MSIGKVLGGFTAGVARTAKAILTAIKAVAKKSYTVEMLVKDGVTIAASYGYID